MRNKFYFSKESFLELKEIVKIINEKDNTPEMLTLEFTGVFLKVYVRYQLPYTKVIYSIKTDKDETESSWVVECPFTKIKEFFLDELMTNMLDDVGVLSVEDSDSDEEMEFMGSVYLCYRRSEESQSLLAPRVRRGILVFEINNTKDTMYKTRIFVNILEVT